MEFEFPSGEDLVPGYGAFQLHAVQEDLIHCPTSLT